MNATPIIIGSILVCILAYRYYNGIEMEHLAIFKDDMITPATRMYDNSNYYPMSKWILFGHHFAAIAGAGPLVGPVLAVQFGFASGLNMKNIYLPQIQVDGTYVKGLINLVLTGIIMICAIVILGNAVPKWVKAYPNNIKG